MGNADQTQSLKLTSGETEAPRCESTQQVRCQACSRAGAACESRPWASLLTWTPCSSVCSGPAPASPPPRLRRPLGPRSVPPAIPGAGPSPHEEAHVGLRGSRREEGMWDKRGWRPCVLLFQRGLPRRASGPVGMGDPGLGGKGEGGMRFVSVLLLQTAPPELSLRNDLPKPCMRECGRKY